MKILYKFKVGKPTIEETTAKNEDGSETVTKNKVYKDTEIFIKKPSHREIDEMDLFYSIQISDLQANKVFTRAMILNSYEDSGGIDSKKELEGMKKVREDLELKRNQFLKESAEKIENPALLEEIKDLYVKLESYNNKLSGIFERSAESIAERRVILWSCLNLLKLKDGDSYAPLFTGRDYKEKLENYYNLLDGDESEFEKKAFEKAQILLGSWFKKQVETEEEFKTLESMIDETEKLNVTDDNV